MRVLGWVRFGLIAWEASCPVGSSLRQSLYLLEIISSVYALSYLTAAAYIPLPLLPPPPLHPSIPEGSLTLRSWLK